MQKLMIAVRSRLLGDLLEEQLQDDFHIYRCHRGDEIPRLLESVRPDAAVLDLCLPGMTGLNALDQASYTPPKVLALTTYETEEIRRRAKHLGVTELLLLPHSLSYILLWLYRHTTE